MNKVIEIAAEPYAFELAPNQCALLIIDMQRDFLEPVGFGEMLGNDVSQLRRTIEPNKRILAAWRAAGLLAMHTREGHRPDLADLPPAKKVRGRSATTIGDVGPMGRILVRGEPGHDIIADLYPAQGEPVIDKPGKGAFHATDLHAILQHRGVKQLVVTGVTTEVCVNTTVREANDRGYDCLVLEDCVGSYFPELPGGGECYGLDAVVERSVCDQPDVYFEGGDHATLVHVSQSQFAQLTGHAPHARFAAGG